MKRWLFAALLALLVTGCAHTVDTGHRGLKVSFGEVEGDPLVEGLYFVNPFTTSIHQMDTRILKWESHTAAYTKDVQLSTISFTLNYQLDPREVGLVYRTVGEDWVEKLVGQQVHQYLKNVVGQWDAVDIIVNRQKVSEQASLAIANALSNVHVLVPLGGFTVTDITFSDAFDKAVEAKVIAQQQALQAQNTTERVKQEAQQKVIQATAEAQSMKIRADALSQNPRLVEWEAVQKWNGELPQYTLGGGVPFIQLPGGKTGLRE